MFIESTYAAQGVVGLFNGDMTFGDFFLLLISLFVLAAGISSLIFVLWGGLLLILSGGKDEKIKPAINTIRYAVIGIIVTVLSIFLFPVLGRLLGIDIEQYARPDAIFAKIEEIWGYIFNTWWNVSGPSPSNSNLDWFPNDFSDL